jgi:ABC-type polysaccharide transport system permease subunit
MGPDLTSKRWIVAKGILFAFLAGLSGVLIVFVEFPAFQRAVLLAICVWAACRFYYFLFHVLHAYVDPTLPSAGVMDLVKHLRKRRRD